jgi:adenylate cyclase
MQKIKPLLIALVVLVPLLAAVGFFRMATEVVAVGSHPPPAPHAAIEQATLAAWKDNLTMAYVGAVLAAFVLGRMHALVRRAA